MNGNDKLLVDCLDVPSIKYNKRAEFHSLKSEAEFFLLASRGQRLWWQEEVWLYVTIQENGPSSDLIC